ncbi:tetratricopeptide repeat protein [Parvicella tangerina]|uniref:Tetratricopeptide repeat protein n=1 Tax=Parvicella tangerina TaxID=2829795 RepID=A0A916JNY0_9FLAO|nr:hypothetical protein [Parvicella tangerina]CAG5084349.1 hypothetical protein CRYO30217_02442 [Parvicella tangerina]
MGHPKDIFKNRGPLTEQEIRDYLSGKLNDAQRRDIELKMAQDEFNLSAMAGFEETPEALAGFEKVKDSVHTNISKSGKKWQFHHTIILAVLLMAGTMILGTFVFPDHGQTTLPSEGTDESNIESIEKTTTLANEAAEDIQELSDEEIEAAVTLDELNIVHAKEVIVESPVIIDSALTSDPIYEDIAIKKSIEVKKVASATNLNIEVPTKDEIIYSNVPLIYMKNFLLVDYSKIYIDPPSIEETEIFGTSPAMANKDDEMPEVHQTELQTVVITYKDYLRETQEKFEQHDFKAALKRYKKILSKYPNDLNAHFYSGLCYFNIGKNDLAIEHFKIAKNHPYNTFQVDAEWYLAKTLCQQGKTSNCDEALNKIIKEGNYYSEQATDLMKKLE